MDYTIEKNGKRESFAEDGISFLDMDFRGIHICVEGKRINKINQFYEEISERCYKYAKEQLLARSRSEYEAMQDERKRFSFRPYRYSVGINYIWQSEQYLSVLCVISIQKRGKPTYIKKIGQTWDKKRAKIISLSCLGAKKSRKIKKALSQKAKRLNIDKINTDSFCLENGKISFFVNDDSSNKCHAVDIILEPEEKANKS